MYFSPAAPAGFTIRRPPARNSASGPPRLGSSARRFSPGEREIAGERTADVHRKAVAAGKWNFMVI